MLQENSNQGQNLQRSILMLPWLAHGHISPFLELAKKLTSQNFKIYFCSTPINLHPLRENTDLSSIQFINLNLPDSPELPTHYHTTKDLPPHLMPLLVTAFDAAKPYFSQLLETIKPGLVIYDCLQPWAPSAATEKGIPACLFLTFSGVASSFFTHYSVLQQNTPFPFPAISFDDEDEFHRIAGVVEHTVNGITNWERYVNCVKGSSEILLVKTCREIEEKYINYLSKFNGKLVAAVGPLIQERQRDNSSSSSIMNWLNQRDPASVVFVSFGSEYFLSREEIEEIAYGIELSCAGFIWVIRFHNEHLPSTISEVLPEGFLQRTKNRGMLIQNWAPQVDILKHSSIGGFVSHCGWSSTLEAIASGVPIIAMPMNVMDQPLNAKLVVELGVAMEVTKRDGKFRRDDVCGVIRDVVVNEGGNEVREKAKELMKKMNHGMAEQIDATIDVIADVIIKE